MTTLIALALRVAGVLGKLPRWAWYLIGAIAGIALLFWLHVRAINRAVADDRAVNAAEAKHVRDSLTIELASARIAVRAAETKTLEAWASRDSAVIRTRVAESALERSRAKLATAILKLPDSLAGIPVVDSLVKACTAFANDCEQLRHDVVVEREAADSAKAATIRERNARVVAQSVSDSSLSRAAATIVSEQQKNAAMSGRISKKAAVVWYILARGIEAGAHRIGRQP